MDMSVEMLLATSNRGKVREIERLLTGLPVALRSLGDFPAVSEPDEDGATFAENALLKARHYSAATGLFTLSDDSGLEVDALGGAPGVHSARFGGREATYAERMALLLNQLAGVGGAGRGARFVCVIALADPVTAESRLFTGKCEGRIAEAPRGIRGFGYDPLFVPEGHAQTFGELPAEVKQEISHRARAVRQAAEFLRSRFGSPA
jgi:XTP/dITP diphosphohydrolase